MRLEGRGGVDDGGGGHVGWGNGTGGGGLLSGVVKEKEGTGPPGEKEC